MYTVVASAGRTLPRLGAAAALLTLLLGVPAGLGWAIGWPLPSTMPTSWAGWQQLLTSPIPDTAILNLLALAGWLLWAGFTRAVWVEAKAAWRGVRAPTRRMRHSPLRASASFLIATVAAGGLATTAAPQAVGPALPAAAPQAAGPAAPTTATPSAGPVNPADLATPARAPLLPAGPAVLLVDGCAHLHTVAQGDSLWVIAQQCLGDGARWPEIWQLNKGRFWPAVSGYKRFDNPDLIYPRWTLTLPAGADTPPAAAPVQPADPPPPSPTPGATPAPATAPGTPASAAPTTTPTGAPADPDGVVPASTPPTTPAANPTLAPAPALTSPASLSPSPPPPTDDTPPPVVADEHGVTLPGGWIPWALAGAIASTAAVVWLQRRRHYLPRPLDGTAADHRPEPPPIPAVVRHIQHAWRNRPGTGDMVATPPSPTDEPAPLPPPPTVAVPPVPAIDTPPAGGLGLTGPGAHAAARGALVAALAAGAPTDPDARTEVVIPADTMITLLGADAVALGTWPRLHVTADLDTALTVLEERLLHAARLLDDHAVDDITALRAAAPTEPPLPAVLLVTTTPPAGIRMRTRAVLGLGTGVGISALLLGEWTHGPTAHVEVDGTCHPAAGTHDELPAQMAVLDTDTAYRLLRTLREAHTGEPDPPAHPEPQHPDTATTADPDGVPAAAAALTDVEVPADANAEQAPAASPDAAGPHATLATGQQPTPAASSVQPPAADQIPALAASASPTDTPATPAAATLPPARIRILGPPDIVDKPTEETVRSTAIELMVYLAVHPDGATPDQIMEDLWPLVRRRLAAKRLHTAASNLRKLLAGSVGANPDDFVVKQRGRYRLNPDTVDVDLWNLRRAHTTARSGVGDTTRLTALRQACQAYTGELAEGEDYEWLTRHRKAALDLAIDAHTALATAIADTDPEQAARLLHTAADHDPLNEHVCQQAMHAYHRLHDADTIRALLRRLALALDEIDAEPSQETSALADRLRRDLDHPHRPT